MPLYGPSSRIAQSVINGIAKAVLYIDSAGKLAQDSPSLEWDSTTKLLKIGESSSNSLLQIGKLVGGGGYGAIYPSNVTPSATNYIFASASGGGSTTLRAVTAIYLFVNTGIKSVLNSTGMSVNTSESPTADLSFGTTSARTININRQTVANTAGVNLTIRAGSATVAATDKNGGNLILQGAISTGTGESGVTLQGNVAGTTGTADNAHQDMVKVLGNKLGFYNVTPVVKATVTGAKGSNAALGSLLTALAGLGLITDSSTA